MKTTTLLYLLIASALLNIIFMFAVGFSYNKYQLMVNRNNAQADTITSIYKDYNTLYSNYETLRGTAQNMQNDLTRLSSRPQRIIIPPPIQIPQWHNVNCSAFGSSINCSGF